MSSPSSTAVSLNVPPSSGSSSYLNDDLKTQEHQRSGATTAQGLNLSGSLTVDGADIASNSAVSFFSQGEDVTFGAQNCLPTVNLNDAESFNASMAAICASIPQAFALTEALNNLGVNNLAQFLQSLNISGFVQGNTTNASSDATTQGASNEDVDNTQSSDDSASTSSSSTTSTTSGASSSSGSSAESAYSSTISSDEAKTDDSNASSTTVETQPETSTSGTNSINLQAILDNVALLIQMQNNCTQTMQNAIIEQNQAQVAALLQAAQDTLNAAQGPLNSAVLNMMITVATLGVTLGAMGYASNEADTQDENEINQHNEDSAQTAQTMAHSLNSGDESALAKSQSEVRLKLASPQSVGVQENLEATVKQSQSVQRLKNVNVANEELNTAQKSVQETISNKGIPTDEQLNDVQTASNKLQEAFANVKPSDFEDFDGKESKQFNQVQTNNKMAINQSNALVANNRVPFAMQRAKSSTEKAIEEPTQENIDQANKDIKTAESLTKAYPTATSPLSHYKEAVNYAQYQEKGPRADYAPGGSKALEETAYDPNDPNNYQGGATKPDEVAGKELEAGNDDFNQLTKDLRISASAKEVEQAVARTTQPLAESKEMTESALNNAKNRATAAANSASEDARCFGSPEARAQTTSLNHSIQKLKESSNSFAGRNLKNNNPGDKVALDKQINETKASIDSNPEAHADVKAQAEEACKQAEELMNNASFTKNPPTGKLWIDPNDPKNEEASTNLDKINRAASKSGNTTLATTNRQRTGRSSSYYNNFQAIFGFFSAINALSQAGQAIITAQGEAAKAKEDQAAGTMQAEAQSYSQGEQSSVSNAQLQSQTLQSLESTYQSISQSETQDVQFVKGAN